MHKRENVSPETLERAIKARVAVECGIKSAGTAVHFRVARQAVGADGKNWRLEARSIPPELRPLITTAACAVAGTFNLR